MRNVLLAAALLAPLPAAAQMPPSTYAGPLGDRIVSGFLTLAASFQDVPSLIVLPDLVPATHLRAGQYLNPTTGTVEGRPYGP